MLIVKNTPLFRLVVLAVTMVLCVVFIILGIRSSKNSKKLIADCTALANGVISNVELFIDDEDDDTDYRYTIDFTDKSGKSYRFQTRRTSSRHSEGETILVYYDPGNISSAYAEFAPPSGGTGFYIAAGLFLFLGLVTLFSRRGEL